MAGRARSRRPQANRLPGRYKRRQQLENTEIPVVKPAVIAPGKNDELGAQGRPLDEIIVELAYRLFYRGKLRGMASLPGKQIDHTKLGEPPGSGESDAAPDGRIVARLVSPIGIEHDEGDATGTRAGLPPELITIALAAIEDGTAGGGASLNQPLLVGAALKHPRFCADGEGGVGLR